MKGCTTTQQGYPRIDDACHILPHTGLNLWPFLVLSLLLIAAGLFLAFTRPSE